MAVTDESRLHTQWRVYVDANPTDELFHHVVKFQLLDLDGFETVLVPFSQRLKQKD